MRKRTIKHTIKVGIFVVLGLMIITSLIFYIGSKQKAFGSKKKVTVTFKNVGGLKTGNAVRFAGVSVGAVEKIKIISDTTVLLTLMIDADDSKFIKKDSKVSISTEGLLGSKYIRITPGSNESESIVNGDHLESVEPVDFEELLSIMNESGDNVKNITGKVDQIMTKINNGEGMLGAIISDPKLNNKVNDMITSFGTTGLKASQLTTKMIEAVDTLKTAGENTVIVSDQLKEFTKKLNNDSSTLGKIINDTVMANQINTTMTDLQITAEEVKETSAQVKNSWLLKLFGNKNKNKKKK